jgi:hypothetical protein
MKTLLLRNSINRSPLRFGFLLIPLVLGCFALSPMAQAVVPAPDGGYVGGNTAEGQGALLNLTTGTFNTGTGYFSLQSNTTGNFNTAIGAGALFNNTAEQNTAIGAGALLSNTTGNLNTASGEAALFFNTIGNQNTATGAGALQSNIGGDFNTATGVSALRDNTTGQRNTALGVQALRSNTFGDQNTATGANALSRNTTGDFNTANGVFSLPNNTTGSGNTAAGWDALFDNTTGLENTAIGFQALSSNTTGRRNTVLGVDAGHAVTTASNVICIGANLGGANINNTCYIGSIFGQTSSGGSAVLINANGKLGTVTSSRRFKDDIKPMDKASEMLFALNPVSFRYKKEIDPTGMSQLGLVAEDVEKVNPDLVVRDNEGKPYSVRYEQVNAMLLNEFLKGHRKVEQQEATIAQLKTDFGATIAQLTARLDEQATQIQKVRVQMEASKAAPQTVANSQ